MKSVFSRWSLLQHEHLQQVIYMYDTGCAWNAVVNQLHKVSMLVGAYLGSQKGQLCIGVHAIHDRRFRWQGRLNVLLHAVVISRHRGLEAWGQL